MKTIWIKDCKTEQEKSERKVSVFTAQKAFSILTGILQDKIRMKEGERNSPKNYELPAYSEYQADTSGYIRALTEVISLLSLEE